MRLAVSRGFLGKRVEEDRQRLDLIIYAPRPGPDEVYVIQRCEESQISGGFLLDLCW